MTDRMREKQNHLSLHHNKEQQDNRPIPAITLLRVMHVQYIRDVHMRAVNSIIRDACELHVKNVGRSHVIDEKRKANQNRGAPLKSR